ncbi:glycosyltransferase family 2 protein [Paenibacillus sp. GM2]|uniref:glycosyltransferase family 2 protein n=1 Tax=Paenibacillus sp. GM2 TaxID=1622070 RepID=UPI000838EA31|nr:glycosyltransferase family 2 protein [Paenibacillus sp. GM2]
MSFLLYVIAAVFLIFQALYTVIPLVCSKVKRLDPELAEKSIAVLVPAYNEELTIKNCLDAMADLKYSNYEIIIINDGSKDKTLSRLDELLQLELDCRTPAHQLAYKPIKGVYRSVHYPHILVIDKQNGGKADSLNAGIDYAASEIVITLDADSMLETNALKYVNQYFHNSDIIALGGTVKIVQGAEKRDGAIVEKFRGSGLIKSQIINYTHGFYVRKLTQSFFNSIVVISGAFGAFYKDVLVQVNGFRSTVGEDIDITLKIHEYLKANRLKKKLVYAPEAVCYTECPENLTNFYKQRIRWQKAFIDCVLIYWSRLSSRFGVGVNLFFAIDGFMLGTFSAFMMLVYIVQMIFFADGNLIHALIFFLITLVINGLQIVVSLGLCRKYGSSYTIQDYIRMFLFSQLDLLTYRNVLLYINIAGTFKYFDNDEGWGFVERKGVAAISQNIASRSHSG